MTDEWGKAGTLKEFRKAKVHTVYKTKDGVRVPSVTTVLGKLMKWQLIKWAAEAASEGIDPELYKQEAGNIGTLIHLFIECNLLRQKPDLNDFTPNQIRKAGIGLRKFIEYKHDFHLEPIILEQPMVSEEHGYGGTIDFYGLVNERLTLLDFKSGKGIYPDHKLQVAAYTKLLEEHGHKVERVKILRIGRDPAEGYDIAEIGGLDVRWEMFWHILQFYKKEKGLGKVLVPLGEKE